MTTQQLEEEMLSNPVRSLQYMLRRLSSKYSFLPQLAVDGVFGERTLEAVMLFQRELAVAAGGAVAVRGVLPGHGLGRISLGEVDRKSVV